MNEPTEKARGLNLRSTHWFQSYGEPVKKRKNWKLRVFLSVFVAAIVACLLWAAPFVPNPLLFFHQPQSDLNTVSKPENWATFAGNPQHTRHHLQGSTIKGSVRWHMTFAESTNSAPSIVDGILYVGEHRTVHALQATTGKAVWKYVTTGPVQSSPAIAGRYIYLGLLDGRLIVLDRQDGELEWEYRTGNYITGSPVVVNGVVYLGSGDGFLYALDAETGDVIWREDTGDVIHSSPVVMDGIVHVATNARAVYGYSAKTGARRMLYQLYRNVEDSPVAANGLVYFTSRDGRLYTIDHRAISIPGSFQWKALRLQLWIMGLPVGRPSPQRGTMWNAKPKNLWRGFTSSPAVTPDRLFLGDRLGFFSAKDAKSGSPIWEFKADSAIETAPLVVGESVYFGTKDGTLYALNQESSQLLWKLQLSDSVHVSPVYGSGLIFVRTKDRMLYAIE
jgi:outer membrane protein assembly factor BamB